MKNLISSLIISVMSVVCVNVSADTSLYLGGWSVHTEKAHATNDKHAFFVLEHDGYLGGHFINSYNESTYIIAKKFKIEMLSSDTYNIRTSFGPAITEGYTVCPLGEKSEIGTNGVSKICLNALVEMQYTKYRFVPTAIFIPQGIVFAVNVKF